MLCVCAIELLNTRVAWCAYDDLCMCTFVRCVVCVCVIWGGQEDEWLFLPEEDIQIWRPRDWWDAQLVLGIHPPHYAGAMSWI